jgi:hypothetical protein
VAPTPLAGLDQVTPILGLPTLEGPGHDTAPDAGPRCSGGGILGHVTYRGYVG